MDARFILLQVCFFLSGFAALLYETAWTREFAFVFGTSELAVSAVLAAYMAGLALGAAIAARWAPRIHRPILAYGVIELGIGVCALLVPFAIRGLMGLYVGWLGGLSDVPEEVSLLSALFHLAGAFVVLIPCTALMGATLPLLARHAVTTENQIGPRIGLLYSVNTAGAICGALTAAFLLLPSLGLRQTIYAGAGLNGLVFLAAAALSRVAPPSDSQSQELSRGPFAILPLIAFSGMVSFIYEVLWVRLLGYVLGGSTAAFATMLSSFLLGIALGSAIASRLAKKTSNAILGFTVIQIAISVFALLTFSMTALIPEWAQMLGASPKELLPGALLSVLILLPVTMCIGATFPFAVRILAQDATDAAAASARVYAWNTLGSIVGSVGAGFLLLPWLGFEGTVLLGAVINIVLAVLAAWVFTPGRRSVLLAVAALAVGLSLLWIRPGPPTEILKSSALGGATFAGDLAYVGVGRSGTVSLFQAPYSWRVVTNGLPESAIQRASSPPDQFHEAKWLSMLPVLVRPEATKMLLIGLGGGNTLSAVPSTIDQIDLIELESEVVEANRVVGDGRVGGNPLDDDRLTLRLGDARGSLMLTDTEYDAIVSQPSHPWTSGASHLYTREFFEMVRDRLAPDGVFVQWMGLAFVNEDLLRGLVGTLGDVFDHVLVFRPKQAAVLFVASNAPFDIKESVTEGVGRTGDEMKAIGVFTPEDVLASLVLDETGAKQFSEGAEPITDDWNRLAWIKSTEQSVSQQRERMTAALMANDPLLEWEGEFDVDLLARRLVSLKSKYRFESLSEILTKAEWQRIGGWEALDTGRRRAAARHFKRSLELDPESVRAAVGLELSQPGSLGETEFLPAREASLVKARRLADEANWESVRELDGELADWGPGSLYYTDALRLRIGWRFDLAMPERADETLDMVDTLIVMGSSASDLWIRAQVAAQAGKNDYAWASLERLISRMNTLPKASGLSRRILVFAQALPPAEGSEKVLNHLKARIKRSR
ncbi:MAG: hypothetical protein CL917_15510 [Deltaproteobacteria bacterium]|nr:hypothetical protein [Deltaproteobacteria bacterium]